MEDVVDLIATGAKAAEVSDKRRKGGRAQFQATARSSQGLYCGPHQIDSI